MIESSFIAGALGNILFGLKSLPQVIHCYKTKSTTGLSPIMLIADFGGNVACTYYIYKTVGFEIWWQFVNYGFATLFLIILFVMMYYYKNYEDSHNA